MKKKKLRGYVLPTLYVLILMLVFGAVSIVSSLFNTNPNYLYSIGILNGGSTPVIGENPENPDSFPIIKPYTSENVEIAKYFYDTKSDEDKQQNSLIYYENTYMKNTGILYSSDEEFDCITVLDGKVANIKDDEVLGKVVEIEHNQNLRTIYYSLANIDVKVGDTLSQGEIIGKSGLNKISDAKNNLLFEVYYNGTLLNPEEFYFMNAEDLL